MIVCKRCGFDNEDSDTFCGSCAGFLEWEGEKVVDEAPPRPEPEPEPEPERAGIIERVKEAIGISPDTAAAEPEVERASAAAPPAAIASPPPQAAAAPPAAAAAPPAAAPAPPPATTTAPPQPPQPQPAQPEPAQPAQPVQPALSAQPVAAAPPVATAQSPTTATAPVQPEAVKPTAVKARPTAKKAAPSRVINPGDKVCGQCGEGNDPARNFCRRCGASLLEAVVFALPWYKRLWRRLTGGKKYAAGDRRRGRRSISPGKWILRLIVLAIVVLVVLTFVGPVHHSFRHRLSTWYHDVVGAVHPTYSPVHATSARATSSVRDHPASNLIDGISNNSWEAKDAGVGQVIVLGLPTPANIGKIGFLNGDQDTPQAFLTQPRPKTLRLTFLGSHLVTKTITLKDDAGFQTFTVTTKSSIGLEIVIASVYPSSQGKDTAMTQVELFSKSS